jgi:replicative DNA helicase
VVVAGATGAGKTLVGGLNLVAEALRHGESVLYLSLEMTWKQLVTRLRAIVAGVDVRTIEWGARFDSTAAAGADDELLKLPGTLYYNSLPVWRLEDVRELMESYATIGGCRFFVVDYIQLVAPGGRERLYEATMLISQQLRYAAQECDAVCVALSQYNRSTSADRGRKPMVQGLLGGSSLENDSSQVLLLDHTRRKRDEIARTEKTWLLLAKNRHGPQCEIPIEFDYRTLRVREALPDEEETWP